MKKGKIPFQLVVIILVIVGSLIAIWFAYFFFVVGHGSTVDAMCKISASGRHYSVRLVPELCSTEPKTIDPGNLDECPYYKDSGYIGLTLYERCAVEQFARYMVSCWDRRGKGLLNAGNFECYTVCIKYDPNRQPVSFSKESIETVMSEASYSDYDKVLKDYKYKDVLDKDRFDFASLSAQISGLKKWPKHWKDKTANSGQIISIWFDDNIKGDKLLLRYKTSC